MPNVQLWSPTDLADFLGVPLKTIYSWRARNIGPPAYRVGRHLRYDPVEVKSWLAAHADEPRGAA